MTRSQSRFQLWIGIPLVCGLMGLSSCSSAKPPTGVLSQAELAVQQASRGKAPEYAALDIYTAREHFAKAQKALAAEDYPQARRLAEQAILQAQLAEAKAEAESAQRTVAELRKSIESLRDEITRRAPRN